MELSIQKKWGSFSFFTCILHHFSSINLSSLLRLLVFAYLLELKLYNCMLIIYILKKLFNYLSLFYIKGFYYNNNHISYYKLSALIIYKICHIYRVQHFCDPILDKKKITEVQELN